MELKKEEDKGSGEGKIHRLNSVERKGGSSPAHVENNVASNVIATFEAVIEL